MAALTGKYAVVTGGSAGIGYAAAKALAAEGATVFISGRRLEELETAAREIPGDVIAVQADSSRLEDLDRMFATIAKHTDHLDIVFANAGIGELGAPVGKISEDHYDRHFDINVKGLVFAVQKALPLLIDGGAIILCSSVSANQGLAGGSIYAATKAAIRSLARSWILDLKDRKIRVNVVSPGPIDTPGLAHIAGGGDNVEAFREFFSSKVPLGRIGQPDDIGKTVIFLASDAASFINGADIQVDGGFAQV